MKNDERFKNSINSANLILVNIQLIITIITIVLAVCYLFISNFEIYFKISLIINLLVMAFNNQKIYKRLPMTIVYLIVAVILLIFTILMVI